MRRAAGPSLGRSPRRKDRTFAPLRNRVSFREERGMMAGVTLDEPEALGEDVDAMGRLLTML